MSFLSFIRSFFKGVDAAWESGAFLAPWPDECVSIYEHINQGIRPGSIGLSDSVQTLPDELPYDGSTLRWSAGSLDGAFGHHVGGQDDSAESVFRCLKAVLDSPSEKRISVFYQSLLSVDVLTLVDDLIERVMDEDSLNYERLLVFVYWLTTQSPDRSAVKIGMALLGMYRGSSFTSVFAVLGRHEEFTLYSAVAFSHSLEDPEPELWSLAQHVDGWGRIHLVERLAYTENEEIKQWMLREGYKNSVMYEYLAYTCATVGGLAQALALPELDEELVLGAGDIIEALIVGGPAKGMDDYADGGKVVQLYLGYLRKRELSFEQFLVVEQIHRYVTDHSSWPSHLCESLAVDSQLILTSPEWEVRAIAELESSLELRESQPFHTAASVAKAVGVDVWEYYYRRQKIGVDSEWFYLMQTKSEERVDMVVTLAEKMIPLEKIATGADNKLGLGLEYKHHTALDYIVQELRHYSGKGWHLVRASLKSPVVRNRNMAIAALEAWGEGGWPIGARAALEEALVDETEQSTRESIGMLLGADNSI